MRIVSRLSRQLVTLWCVFCRFCLTRSDSIVPPLPVIYPSLNITSLTYNDWLPLKNRLDVDLSEKSWKQQKPLLFYNQSIYPEELLVQVHIPKTGKMIYSSDMPMTIFKSLFACEIGYKVVLRYLNYFTVEIVGIVLTS